MESLAITFTEREIVPLLKKGARVPELRVKGEGGKTEATYPLVGDRYRIGRSPSSCDITIRNPLIGRVHCSLHRDPKNPNVFLIKDENSINGVYLGKRRLQSLRLRHGDRLTLAPPDLADAVTIEYYNPPPLPVRLSRYGLYAVGGMVGLLALGIFGMVLNIDVYPLPSGVTSPVVVYASDGVTPLEPSRQETHQELKKLGDFSPYLPKAVIASEDSRFYWHFGVDFYGIFRAIVVNLRSGGARQGASTLTQQVARTLFPEVGNDKTWGRKFREMVVAIELERVYSKDELLKTYLDRVFLGWNAHGFEDAARFYFDKSARDLTLAEAATLVGMLPGPNKRDPIRHYETSVTYRAQVIDRMAKLGMITAREANEAKQSPIEVSPKAKQALSRTIAPYFYNYVFKELEDLLGEEVAKEGNFIVETSLDPRIQSIAEKALQKNVAEQGARYRYSQGAMVTLDTRTGEILALVGGVDYRKSQVNRAVQSERQPGSTFKVFAYASALLKKKSPAKLYSCDPLSWGGQVYKHCEDSGDSRQINMYQGIARSENVVALRVAKDAGLNDIVKLAERMGIESPLDPVPGLVLGQSEVNLLEITGAYAVFDNNGIWNRPHAIRRVLDGGDCKKADPKTCPVIYSWNSDNRRQALPKKVAETMTRLLRGTITEENGTGKAARLDMGEAGKTGTTDRGVDLWFIGYVPRRDLVTGIWLGNDNNSPTSGSSQQAARLWGTYTRQIVRFVR